MKLERLKEGRKEMNNLKSVNNLNRASEKYLDSVKILLSQNNFDITALLSSKIPSQRALYKYMNCLSEDLNTVRSCIHNEICKTAHRGLFGMVLAQLDSENSCKLLKWMVLL